MLRLEVGVSVIFGPSLCSLKRTLKQRENKLKRIFETEILQRRISFQKSKDCWDVRNCVQISVHKNARAAFGCSKHMVAAAELFSQILPKREDLEIWAAQAAFLVRK